MSCADRLTAPAEVGRPPPRRQAPRSWSSSRSWHWVAVGAERHPQVARDTATLLTRLRSETSRAVDEVRDAARIDPPSDEE